MCAVCWITKATGTLSEYVVRIVFPRHKRLRERASVLPFTLTLPVMSHLEAAPINRLLFHGDYIQGILSGP